MIKKESSAFARTDTIEKNNSKIDIEDYRFSGKPSWHGYYGGFPLLYNDETGRLIIDPSDNHQIVFGATGSKKTRAVIMPAIKTLAHAGESMIIHDTKGELFARHSLELQNLGYNIITISLRNPSVGNAWNPLLIPFSYYMQGDNDKANEFSNDVARSVCMANVSEKDPYWQTASADTLFGLILLLMEYVKESGLSSSEVNISNLIKLKRELFNNSQKKDPKNTDIWKWASENELIYAALSGTVLSATDTRAGVISTLDSSLRMFVINQTLTDMLSDNTIDIAAIGQEKTAVFLITPDEKTSMSGIVSLFVQQSYQYLIYKTIETGGQSKVRINYILDEFSSLPVIGNTGDFVSMISAARSRNIRYLIACQSLGALKKRYKEETDAIIANCTNILFLFSRELELLKYLSELCGTKSDGKPNITISELQQLDKDVNQTLLFNGRSKPALVNLLDIDDFSKKKGSIHLEPVKRNEVSNIDFSQLPQSIMDVVDKVKSREQPINGRPINPFLTPGIEEIAEKKNLNTIPNLPEDDLDIDEMIKNIDAKIEKIDRIESISKRIKERAKEIDSKKEVEQ